MAALISKPGITRLAGNAVPLQWSQNWYRDFISDYLKGADVRNAVGTNGITVSGTISSPYATIGLKGPITIAQPNGVGEIILGVPPTGSTLVGPGSFASAVQFAGGFIGSYNYPNGQNLYIASDFYYDGTDYTYQTNATGCLYVQNNSSSIGHQWYTAPSGTAGTHAGVSLAEFMRLSIGGGLTVNVPAVSNITVRINSSSSLPIDFIEQGNLGATASGLAFVTGYSSPARGRLIIGDGSGWQWYISKRAASATTDLFTWFDSGTLLANVGSTTALAINSAGANFGQIGNVASQLWALGSQNSANSAVANITFEWGNSGSQIFFPGNTTSATGTGAVLSTTSSPLGQLFRTSSSLRYKANVQSIQPADIDALLQMRPVTYTSTSAVDDPTAQHLGLIAEEVFLIDPRLVQMIPSQIQNDRPVEGAPLVPESVSYDRLTVLLVGAVQMLTQRIAALEANTAPLSVSGSHALTGTNVVTTAEAVTVLLQP